MHSLDPGDLSSRSVRTRGARTGTNTRRCDVFPQRQIGPAARNQLTWRRWLPIFSPPAHGAIAQLGERLHGMQEVDGSIPSGSTRFHRLHLFTCFSMRPHRLEA